LTEEFYWSSLRRLIVDDGVLSTADGGLLSKTELKSIGLPEPKAEGGLMAEDNSGGTGSCAVV
jgi:hypothetical protein